MADSPAPADNPANQSTRQLLDSQVRQAVLQGDLRRFWAELERSVGHKLPAAVPIPREGATLPTPPEEVKP